VEARRRTPRARVALAMSAALAIVAFVAGCGTSRYEYVTNKGDGTFLKVPRTWDHARVAGSLAFVGIDSRNLSPEMAQQIAAREWLVTLDANGAANGNLLSLDATKPKGFVQVRKLLPEEAAAISTNDLRNQFVDLDAAAAAQQQAVQKDPVGARLTPQFLLLADDAVTHAGGVHGVHLVYELRTTTGLTTIDQTSLLDQDSTTIYQLVMACSSLCFAQYGGDVEHVASSFTIKPS
jgi:hypothetical protein